MMLRRNVFLKIVLTSCLVALVSCARGSSDYTGDYLTIVKLYADAMIKDGRDVYGTEHSPLFASALDRTTKLGHVFPFQCRTDVVTVQIGLRDIDSGEGKRLRQSGVHAFTMEDIDRRRLADVVADWKGNVGVNSFH